MENERERDVIAGRNAVTEALKAGRPIDSILVRRGEKNGSVSSILRMAKQAGIPVKEVDSRKLDGMCGGENHQGVIAMAAVHAFSEVEDIFALAESRNEPPFILVCDEIADPHNLGAILRTAECAGRTRRCHPEAPQRWPYGGGRQGFCGRGGIRPRGACDEYCGIS